MLELNLSKLIHHQGISQLYNEYKEYFSKLFHLHTQSRTHENSTSNELLLVWATEMSFEWALNLALTIHPCNIHLKKERYNEG